MLATASKPNGKVDAFGVTEAYRQGSAWLKAFWKGKPQYLDAEVPTLAWCRDVLKADWAKPSDVKAQFATASILRDGRVVEVLSRKRPLTLRMIEGLHTKFGIPAESLIKQLASRETQVGRRARRT